MLVDITYIFVYAVLLTIMKMRKRLMTKREFSLVTVALILMLSTLAYAPGGLGVMKPVLGYAPAASLTIENVITNTTHIAIYVRNTGTIDVQLSGFYVNGVLICESNSTIHVGKVKKYLIGPVNMTEGTAYEVKIMSTDGASYQYCFVAQGTIIPDDDWDPLIEYGASSPPVADFTCSPPTLILGEPATFDASSSLPGWNGTQEMPITEYRWLGFDQYDSNVTLTPNPIIVHTFPFLGGYNVTLTVTDSEGLDSSISRDIFVTNPTFVSISTSSSSTYVGYKVNINGTLHDLYGKGLENEPVVISYTFQGAPTWFPISSGITDNGGHYYVQWIPSASGYFTIKAEWAGNATHEGTSNTTTLSSLAYNNQYVFTVESNSTISELTFNTTDQTLTFTATGPSGTRGQTKVTIAKSLVANATGIRVYLDGNDTQYSIASTDDSWLLTFNYTHSTHKVAVDLNVNPVSEFPSITVLLLFMLLAMFASVILGRRIKTRATHG